MTKVQPAVNEYTLQPLGPDTWDAFAALAERHNGVWGGCWCTWFHTLHGEKTFSAEDNRDLYRRDGVAATALRGALDLIAQEGGGIVEAYPQDTGGKNLSLLPLQRHPGPLRAGRLQL